ncbi:NYN domain-containing protein [Rugamonas sp.]|uniref:NYN domain-containing protein n=1 Tax=Rugamonas sp. TaxID=1926287 RepID=UPI0025FC72CE|nr:NYN domain-containing protein [Rugamonas sp.]
MASSNDNVSMALFCDFENVALGVRDANYDKFDIKPVLERLLLKGSIVVKKAYCDWDRYKAFKAPMHEANFELIEIPHVRQSGKNSADIRMVVDALDLCYTKSHVDTFVIISGDSDFSPLVSKLRENAKKVIGVGVKQSTSDLLVANCDEFIFYDDLVRESRRAAAKRDPREATSAPKRTPEEESKRRADMDRRRSEAVDIAVGTFDALVSERGDSGKIWASVLKEAIKRRKPDFSESYYGFRTFGNLLEEAKARGLLEFGRDEKSGAYVFRSSGLVPVAGQGGDGQDAMAAAEMPEAGQEAAPDAPSGAPQHAQPKSKSNARKEFQADAKAEPRKEFKGEAKADGRKESKDGKDGKRGRGRGGRSAAERFADRSADRNADRGADTGPVNHRRIADIKADQLAFAARQAAAENDHDDDHHDAVAAQPAPVEARQDGKSDAKQDGKQEPRRGRGRGGRSAAERYAERNAERGADADVAAAPAPEAVATPAPAAVMAPVVAQTEAGEGAQDTRRGRGNRGNRKTNDRHAEPVATQEVAAMAAPAIVVADSVAAAPAPVKAKRAASAKPAASAAPAAPAAKKTRTAAAGKTKAAAADMAASADVAGAIVAQAAAVAEESAPAAKPARKTPSRSSLPRKVKTAPATDD